ncbi:MAG: hypothetical protein AAGA44_05710 [Pseudomonadota bacterium]
MKLRIRGNSLRLRLTRAEVEKIGLGETVFETTQLAGGVEFGYTLEATQRPAVRATMAGTQLTIHAPAAALADWAGGDDVALDSPCEDGTAPVLIEKDFACLTPRDGSDDNDTFPHPESGAGRC